MLEGIDKDGNWIVNGLPIAIGASIQVDEGLTVGQTIQVHAELMPGGSLLARRAGKTAKDLEAVGEIKLEGVFQGINELTGDWIISGLPIRVGLTADTEGLPSLGQTIKVLARLEDDGSLLVREIENRLDSEYTEAGRALLKLQGAFSGVDGQGNWEINSVKFAVDRSTRLEGTPTLGRTIEVEAIRQEDGSLLARSIEGETPVGRLSGSRGRTERSYRGSVGKWVAGDSGNLDTARHSDRIGRRLSGRRLRRSGDPDSEGRLTLGNGS